VRRFASLRRRSEFAFLRRRGRMMKTPDLTLYHTLGGSDVRASVGISIGKAVGGAVIRNLLRRRLQSILQASLSDVPQRLLILPQPGAALLNFRDLSDQLRRILRVLEVKA